MTHQGLLEYLCSELREQRRLFDQPILELNIGTHGDIQTVCHLLRTCIRAVLIIRVCEFAVVVHAQMPEDAPLIQVLQRLIETGLSAIPLVNSAGEPSRRMHVFHAHKLHFLLLRVQGRSSTCAAETT